MRHHQVVVVGAGPVGLWLAAELRLGGVDVLVLEARAEPDPNSKALAIHPRTLEMLASRGLLDRFLAEGSRIPSGHFAALGARLDFRLLDTPYQFTLSLPQVRTEQLLETHARSAGADIRRGRRVVGLTARAESVVVHLEEGTTVEAEWVVGCDGVRSTVRQAAGIAYPGTGTTMLGWLGDVELADPPPQPVLSEWTEAGLLMVVRLPGDCYRLIGITPEDLRTDRRGALTLDELRAKTVAIAGTDWAMHSPKWLSRYGNASRQAERYRADRVLLAGDAAHQHMPAGGVGMNLGLADAMNLGWKLAATISGRAPQSLLDTYHTERHPIGVRALRSTQAQAALMTSFSPEGRQLRTMLSDLIGDRPEFARALAEQLSGLSVAYPAAPGAHALTGHRAPDLALADGRSLFATLTDARHVLVDIAGGLAPVDELPLARAVPIHDRPEWAGVTAALVRPDGYLAWVGSRDTGPVPRVWTDRAA
ncbi:FAD-dependent monooxygenase [Nocardia beijingensis]|uniref:FAD-dependent monooxygenase n=1 Tax=Nocardia beijingensis TaxID=95162 RepID=UPI0018940126|nr:FAD-dependent monooxygenase [Nocardia beijingensis]MBF6468298.1 FAD-dependent monooxygenase [Nocardia beijingensis]